LLTALALAITYTPSARAHDAPVSPNALPEVATLLDYLGSLRGKYILSGQQEFPGWPDVIEIGQASDPDFKRVLDVTGQMPAVRGFDFLFYTHSDSGRATQRSTERAIQWWQQGGIVTFACHMFVTIGSTDGTPKFYTPAAGGANGGTTFDISRAVTAGTPENTEMLQKFDLVAAELKKLRDARVPVIWRPFHECSGGWFWWGAKGATPFKAAYRLMFERFTQVHGLNNLIWVYNPTDAAGALESRYPGDDVVDMITLDIYPTTGTHPTYAAVYQQQYDFRSGRKVIGLSENGAIPDPDALFTEGAYWSYFCTWNGSFIQDGVVNPADFLQRVYTHPRVLTRDESSAMMPRAGVSPTIAIQPLSATAGTGANVTLAVVARGSVPLTYQWRKGGVELAGAEAAALTLASVTAADTADYSVVVTNSAGSVTSDTATLTVDAAAFTPRANTLVNISTRARVGTGDRLMIPGFVVAGSSAKRVLIRAVGPTLANPAIGVAGVLADPELVLTTQTGTVLATNDDWETGQDAAALSAAFTSVSAFRLNAGGRDAALIAALPPGNYTALVRGVAEQTGIALVEIYDLDTHSPARLANLSTRAEVGEGANVVIIGFYTEGTGSADLLLRAAGPELNRFHIPTPLADPRLELTLTDGTPVAANDDWQTAPNLAALTQFASSVYAFSFAAGGKDAALLQTVPAGTVGRTAIISAPPGTTGIALAEIYQAP
ncbi:MAG: hypothetical protein IAE82_07745, partial [Opitutaceae bacterium]|nr:hypothetical protein [Opitutaceae bacterium]